MIGQLRIRFVCIMMVLVTALTGLLFALVYSTTRAGLEKDVRQALQAAARGEMLPQRPGEQQVLCFTVDVSGRGHITVAGNAYFDLTDMELLSRICQSALNRQAPTGTLEEYELCFQRQAYQGGQRIAFADISGQERALGGLLRSFVIFGAVGFLGFLGISVALAFWAVAPVARAWQQQRQFVADASHELKTPLTVIHTNAELLREETYSAEEKARFSQSILVMTGKMRSLVEGLLELARGDQARGLPLREQVDMSRLTEEAVLPFEPLYFEQGLQLHSHIQPGLQVLGDGQKLGRVAQILLDNGLKYSAPGGDVWLMLERNGRGRVQLTVSTPGLPLTPEQCRDIFRRFYRVDPARSGDGSYGLGLSIARQIVQEHGGKIWAQSRDDRNYFYVNLPEG